MISSFYQRSTHSDIPVRNANNRNNTIHRRNTTEFLHEHISLSPEPRSCYCLKKNPPTDVFRIARIHSHIFCLVSYLGYSLITRWNHINRVATGGGDDRLCPSCKASVRPSTTELRANRLRFTCIEKRRQLKQMVLPYPIRCTQFRHKLRQAGVTIFRQSTE